MTCPAPPNSFNEITSLEATVKAFRAPCTILLCTTSGTSAEAKQIAAGQKLHTTNKGAVPFAWTADAGVVAKFCNGTTPNVVAVKDKAQVVHPFKGDFAVPEAVDAFASHNRLPLVTFYNQRTSAEFFAAPFTVHMLLFTMRMPQKNKVRAAPAQQGPGWCGSR